MSDPNNAPVATHSSPLLVVVAWALVVIPTAWGLNYTVQNAMKIFTAPAPAATSPAPVTPATAKP